MNPRLAITALGSLLVLFVAIQSAWVSDDAFITLRVADNALSGHGLRWNVIERVQAYTHPLWLAGLIPAYALLGDAWSAACALGLVVSTLALLAVLRHAKPGGALIAIAAMVSSKALIDYSTSGLENPLTHLALALLLLAAERRSLVTVALLASALALSRPDAVLLALPVLAWLARTRGSEAWRALLLGALPLLLWELFSLVYYGSLVPNTALAKLGHGLPRSEVILQGLRYALHPCIHDPLTVLLVLAGPMVALRSRRPEQLALAAGGALYSIYVIAVGGDFMAGRFWTPPAFVGVALLSRARLPLRGSGLTAGAILLVGLLPAGSPLRAGRSYDKLPAWNGIVDERGYYHRASGLRGAPWGAPRPDHPWVDDGRRVAAAGQPSPTARACVGYFGFFAGPGIHVLDRLALADPLLARLPAEYDPHWRIGHFRRGLPVGYDPLAPAIEDPALAALYSDVQAATQSPLLEPRRWAAIGRLLLGTSEPIAPFPYRFHHLREASVEGPTSVPERGLSVPVQAPGALLIERGRGAGVRVLAVAGQRVLATWDVAGTVSGPRFQTWRAAAPTETERVLLFPLSSKSATRVRRVEVVP